MMPRAEFMLDSSFKDYTPRMTKRLRPLAVVVVLGFARAGAAQPEPPEVKVKLKDLPAAVQKAVQEQTAQARLKGLTKEIEGGQTFFEAELAINGRTRDVLFDTAGRVVQVEEEIPLVEAPAAVRSALAGKGKLQVLERVTKGNRIAYEAHVSNKGKTTEIVLDADGKPTKL